jgi:hypothetical protein
MKLRDGLTLAAIVGSLALIFVITRFDQLERVKPGSPEYDAYIEHYIAECLRNPQSVDKGASEPASQAEREAACRASVLQADRLIPRTGRSSISGLAHTSHWSRRAQRCALTNA